MQSKFCPLCMAYLLDHTDIQLKGWKKCPGCGYAEDPEGYNLKNPKPKTEGEADEPDQNSETKDKKQRAR